MQMIRLHLGPLPPMLRAMITDLLGPESDMMIVGNSDASEDSLLAANAERADILITQDSSVDQSCLTAVIESTPATILAIASNGDTGTSVNLVRSAVSLASPEMSSLADTVRQVVRGPPPHGESPNPPNRQPHR